MDVRYKKIKDGWLVAESPPDEIDRMIELKRYQVLDTEPTQHFDNITELLSKLLSTKMTMVSLVDKDRQWFKSACGLDANQTPRDQAFCAHAIWHDDMFVVPNALEDDRFKANPIVEGEPHVRFYAGSPLRTSNGYRIGTLCAMDVEPRDKLSDEHAYILQSLSEIVIDELELHLRKIASEEKETAKSFFLASMSNELRDPVNRIIDLASLLESSQVDDLQKRYINTIQHTSNSILELMESIFDFSSIESGKVTLQNQDIELHVLLNDVCAIAEEQCKVKNIEFVKDIAQDVPQQVQGDARHIKQILSSIIGNAIKFTSQGSISLAVSLEDTTKGNQSIISIVVKDTGVGIAKEKIDSICTKFETAKNTNDQSSDGFGLAISKLLANLMAGDVTIESQEGRGTTATVTIVLQNQS